MPEGYPVDGTVFFKDGASIDGFNTELYQGSLCMGEGTAIRGSLDAWQGSSFIIEGFTTMDGQYSVHAVKPGAVHTVLVRMTDSMEGGHGRESRMEFYGRFLHCRLCGFPGVRSGRQPPQHSL